MSHLQNEPPPSGARTVRGWECHHHGNRRDQRNRRRGVGCVRQSAGGFRRAPHRRPGAWRKRHTAAAMRPPLQLISRIRTWHLTRSCRTHFLSALETSKSVGGRTGWQPQHLLVQAADGTLLAAAPCYLKSHSRGEYVFDAGWAEAFARAGGNYYPKLQVAVPFTPAPGRRLLVRPGPHAEEAPPGSRRRLLELCRIDDASGVHVTFATEAGIPLSRRTRLPPAHRSTVPLGKRRVRDVRGFPRRARFAQAQDHPPRTPGRSGERRQRALAHRQRSDGRQSGMRSLPSTWRPARANGAAPISPASSFPSSAKRCATASCW